MPNTPVPAAGEAMPWPSYNRAEIMNAAHRYAQMYRGRDWSYAYLLKHGLKNAWAVAKEGLTPAQRRAEAIRAEIEFLSYKPARYDIIPAKLRLEAELSALAA
ncbi:hypothetical protein ATER59S_05066 [Aquamicrobium terrae]